MIFLCAFYFFYVHITSEFFLFGLVVMMTSDWKADTCDIPLEPLCCLCV